MENFEDFENKSYQAAAQVHYTISDQFRFLSNLLGIIVKVTLILISETFENLVKLVKGRKPKSISGQNALVTGGANGLGRAIAFRLAQEGCNVVIIDLNLIEAQKTASEIKEKFKVETAAYKVDVSDYVAIQQLKKDIENTLGTVDILVNNAGIISAISLREGRPSDIQKLVNVNLTSHLWTVRTFLNKMIEQKRGHIVAIASMGGKISFPMGCGYCATKFGVRGFMNSLHDELCAYDNDDYIKTTCVYPAFINTRKELGDLLDKTREVAPRMSPRYVANEIVDGILNNRRDVTLPKGAWMMQITNFLPTRAYKYVKTKVSPVDHLKKSKFTEL